MDRTEIFVAEDFSVSFLQYGSFFQKKESFAVRHLNLRICSGEMTAVAGASGSGKSLLAHGILGVLPYNAKTEGKLYYRGEILSAERQKSLRGREIVLVPQNVSYLDPLMKVGDQICNGDRSREAAENMEAVLARYGLSREVAELYPFQLSGGMARRVLIAAAAMKKPRLVVADEPTPGLHREAALRVLGHFREMAEQGAAVLLITHDLELAVQTADKVAVLYGGEVVENAPALDFASPDRLRHPYSRALVAAMPKNWDKPFPGRFKVQGGQKK